MVLVVLLLIFLPSFAAADVILSLEYYHTSNTELIDKIIVTKLMHEEQKEKLNDDLLVADDSSRRTLNALLDIFEWYQTNQFRKAMTWESMVFSSDFIVPENEISSRSVILSGRQLDISFNVQEARDRHVPVGMNILYDYRELYSDIPRVYPFDKPILLSDVNTPEDSSQDLEILILKITYHETEEPDQEETLQQIPSILLEDEDL